MAESSKYRQQVVVTFKKLLQDTTHADFTIKVGSDTINAHAAVVCCRCSELIGFPSVDEKSKKKAKRNEIKLKDGAVTPPAMHKVLEFLYTGEVDFQKLADKEILLLVKAARHFKLDRLSYLCEEWLNGHMTIESVFHLLKAATDLDEERIKGFCLQFALKNYNDFIANKDGIYILGIELFQEVVAAFQTNPSPPASIYPEGGPPDTLLSDFKTLYEKMPYSDFSLACGSETIKCHKGILLAYSDVLGASLVKEADQPVRISPAAMKNVLMFCYYGYGVVEAKPACELVGFCRKNKLPTLLRICEDKIRNSIDYDTVLDILSVSYLPADGKQDLVDELQSKCFPFILENLDKVNLTMAKAFNPLMTVDLLLQLQNSCKQNKYGLGCIMNVGGSGAGGNDAGASAAAPPPASRPPRAVSPPAAAASNPTPPRRNQPPPPTGVKVPPPNDNRPPPPPRSSSKDGANLPPPVIGGAPSPARETSGSNLNTSAEKVKSKGDGKTKVSKKDKKEEERRKKEEQKRIAKERKERQKLEKKSKKNSEIF